MITAVVLDMDGVMIDTVPIYKRLWQGAAQVCGYQLKDELYLTLLGNANFDVRTRSLVVWVVLGDLGFYVHDDRQEFVEGRVQRPITQCTQGTPLKVPRS